MAMSEAAVATEAKKAYSAKVQTIIESLKSFTLMELKELKEGYEETFGVKAAAGIPMGMMPMGAAGGASPEAAKAAEPTSFTVVLKEIGDKKIQVIKVVRELTGLGLKEAKDLVDSTLQGPAKVKENLPKAEAEAAQKKLTDVGAVVTLSAV
jgi:large subunit ribosomal protein L7/L12